MIQRQGVNPWGIRQPMLIWRGVVGTVALFCFYSAISQLPLAAATVLQYLYPTFTAAFAWGALGERAGKRILLAMALPVVRANPVWPNAVDWAWLVGVGLFTQLGQIFLTQGLASMPAARATALNYVQVVFAALWGLLFLGESINELMVMGAVLVLGATLISIKPPRTPQPLH